MNALPVSQIDKQWSLFLDRDGVINRRIVDAYVRDPSEFVFLPRVPEAMALLRRIFGYVFLVTNQQGIGKGLMGVDDLERVHAYSSFIHLRRRLRFLSYPIIRQC